MAEGFDTKNAIMQFAGNIIEPGEKKILEVKTADGSVVKIKVKKKKAATKATPNLFKWAKDHFKKKKKKSGGYTVQEESLDGDYEVVQYDTDLYMGTSHLPNDNPYIHEAVYQKQIPFLKLLLPRRSLSCTDLTARDTLRLRLSNPTARQSAASEHGEILNQFDERITPPANISRSAPSSICVPDIESPYDEMKHTYLLFGNQERLTQRKESGSSNDSHDSLYVIPKLQSRNNSRYDFDQYPVRLSQSSIMISAVERDALLGRESPNATSSEEMSEAPNYIVADSRGENGDGGTKEDRVLYASPYDSVRIRSRSIIESQYTPIETDGIYDDFSDRESSVGSTTYQSDVHRLSYLADLHRELQIQHPHPPVSSGDASTMSSEPMIQKRDNEDDDSLRSSDSSTYDSMSEEDRINYLLQLHSDIEKGKGDYCTISRNASWEDDNPGYLNVPCDGVVEEQALKGENQRAPRVGVDIQSGLVPNDYIDMTINLDT